MCKNPWRRVRMLLTPHANRANSTSLSPVHLDVSASLGRAGLACCGPLMWLLAFGNFTTPRYRLGSELWKRCTRFKSLSYF